MCHGKRQGPKKYASRMNHLKLITLICVLVSCERVGAPIVSTALFLYPGVSNPTRSQDPDAYIITDYNLMVFNSLGLLEEKIFVSSRDMEPATEGLRLEMNLLKGAAYTILAAANIGYSLPPMTLEEALRYRCHLAYPDEFSRGIPMSGLVENAVARENGAISVPLQRLMARLDVETDTGGLDHGVTVIFREAAVGACPSSALLFSPSKRDGAATTFYNGYSKKMNDGRATLYLLESLGEERGPYVELKAEYFSDKWHTVPGGRVIYRFYPDGGNVRRNSLYTIRVKLKGDGLSADDGWSIDRGDLAEGR